MQSGRVREFWNILTEIGFRTKSRNPEWYKAVVVTMLLGSGKRREIDERAREVVRSLGLTGITFPKGSRPCFHLGHRRPRNYFMGTKGQHGVGDNHSLDDFGVYCATHNRSWRMCETPSDPCTPNCRYGMRLSPRGSGAGDT